MIACVNLEHLDAITRRLMCEEIALDEERGTAYQDPRLKPGVFGTYLHLLREAAAWGDAIGLAEAIRSHRLLAMTERRTRNGRTSQARVPRIAAEVLAEMELNRYYVRAVCRRAIEEHCQVQVYRARVPKQARPESELRIGTRMDPEELLEDLRENSDRLKTSLGVPAGPKSGISVRLIRD
jgi:hypothetical protein